MSDQAAIHCREISKSFAQGPQVLTVLKGVNFSVEPGERVAILGRSGSGKSTLLHILGGLSEADSGKVFIGETSMTDASGAERAALRNQKMGFVYQFHHLLPEFNALENVALPMLLGKADTLTAQNRAEATLEAVGLKDRVLHKPSELSGGERQRVAIARALVTRPLIVLADEPTGNLDRESAEQVYRLMCELSESFGTAFVVVTHDISMAQGMHRSLRLEGGVLHSQPAQASHA